jgi:predicted nucleotidyltransferase component of viral defense system
MIAKKSITKEWIKAVSQSKKADKILVEKVIWAFILLEGLVESGLDFVFKGGTALVLLFDSSKRLSIDIDIIVPDKSKDLSKIIAKLSKTKGFTGFEKQERIVNSHIPKEHYKLLFHSAIMETESSILLDILKEDIHYKNIMELPIDNIFIQQEGNSVMVRIPDFNNILADKLTAYAPNTTGVPYRQGTKEMGMEIVKQMYDIGCLFDKAVDLEIIKEVFYTFAETELAYHGNKCSIKDVLNDIIETSFAVCLRQNIGNTDFFTINKGITQVKSFIFSESFHVEKAIVYAAKAAYLAALLKYDAKNIKRYSNNIDMKDWIISSPMNTKLNKLKKTDTQSFFYLYQISEMMKK